MGKGISLHVGLNAVDPKHYQGWSGELAACEMDANDMAMIAEASGFGATVLLTEGASRQAVTNVLENAAAALEAGDIFFLTYSGHGGQVPDTDGDEPDGLDETWCLFDGEFVDDEIYYFIGRFAAGVRLLILSDSCHSGSVIKDMALMQAIGDTTKKDPTRYRAMPPEVAQRTYLANRAFYDGIGNDPRFRNSRADVKASALLISGCQDNQLSADGAFNGRFTGTLKLVWNGGKFDGDYQKFHSAIVRRMPRDQTPNYFFVGEPNPAFELERPFTINPR
ncbi:caspase family protein [Mesorhizobium sp. B263B2A]|uniref:caspase family protein n=1 Tax=Mesorhizobium sp. B263B2A TaxID=2876669 RepID=UPI001CD0A929|nr:caspase family protein [Mesorhizobium sp. B263B2A]MCA0032653.1 caspase family protein [Mesorhizobium sp. B263B2A]